ncbi:MAG: cell division protein SepF [Lachnospiraceae bacterium]|nr:cell division protein SepF [Lachnospiraceae bacterium]
MANFVQNFLNYLKLSDDYDEDDYDEYEGGIDEEKERQEKEARARQRAERRAARQEARAARTRDEDEDDEDDVPVRRPARTQERTYSRSTDRERTTSSRSSSRAAAPERRYGSESRRSEDIPVRNVSTETARSAQSSRQAASSTRMERTTSNKVVPIRTTSRGLEVCVIKPRAFEEAQDVCDMLLLGRAVILNLEGIDQTEAQRIIDFVCGTVYAVNGKLHAVARYIFIFSPSNIDISGEFAEFFSEDGFGVPKFGKDF